MTERVNPLPEYRELLVSVKKQTAGLKMAPERCTRIFKVQQVRLLQRESIDVLVEVHFVRDERMEVVQRSHIAFPAWGRLFFWRERSMKFTEAMFAEHMRPITGSAIREIFKLLARPGMISFAGGNPSNTALEPEVIAQLSAEVLEKHGVAYTQTTELDAAMPELDILYMTRVQQERFTDPMEYEKVKNTYNLTASMLGGAKDNMKILHPLPRVNEIAVEIDSDPRARYFDQMKIGMYVRMALIAKLLGVA